MIKAALLIGIYDVKLIEIIRCLVITVRKGCAKYDSSGGFQRDISNQSKAGIFFFRLPPTHFYLLFLPVHLFFLFFSSSFINPFLDYKLHFNTSYKNINLKGNTNIFLWYCIKRANPVTSIFQRPKSYSIKSLYWPFPPFRFLPREIRRLNDLLKN